MVPGQWLSKPQASSPKLCKVQAASFKPQATRFKLQATSYKVPNHGPFIKFYGPRTEVLNADETIVWVCYMVGNLMWTKSDFVTLRDFKLNSKIEELFRISQCIWHAWNCQIFYTVPYYFRSCSLKLLVEF